MSQILYRDREIELNSILERIETEEYEGEKRITEAELKRKISSMYTDPSRIHPTDPGRVEGNPVFIYHDAFNSNREEVEDLKGRYKTGKVGDVEVKDKLFKVLNELIAPIREKRAYYEAHQDEVKEIIAHGTAKTRAETQKTLNSVLEKIQLR